MGFFCSRMASTLSWHEQPWHGYEDGKRVTFEADPYTSIWWRMGVGFMRIMPIESQL
jgi:putative cardiolipin synthase